MPVLTTPEGILTPDPGFDRERIEVVEAALGPLIDRHLRWVPIDESPTAGISPKQYGYMPTVFGETEGEGSITLRPDQEPLNYRHMAGEVLGVDPNNLNFEAKIRAIDGHHDFSRSDSNGWYRFLMDEGILTREQAMAMKLSSDEAYRVASLTEDNDPAYMLKTMGAVKQMADRAGIATPALEEWFRGIWIAEEDAHKSAMQDYGATRRITTSDEHHAARNSQLRAGIHVKTDTVTDTFIFVPRQEYATKLDHHRNGHTYGPVGYQMQDELSQDETLHYDLYTQVLKALYEDERFTEEVILMIRQEYPEFRMPGYKGIPNYRGKAAKIAKSQIYGVREDFESAKIVLDKIGMFKKQVDDDGNELEDYANPDGLSEEATIALTELRAMYDREFEPSDRKGRPKAFILGETVTVARLRTARRDYKRAIGLPSLRNKRIPSVVRDRAAAEAEEKAA